MLPYIRSAWPGLIVCVMGALAAQFVSLHYGAPAMLMALLFGMAMQSALGNSDATPPGVALAASGILKLGVGLLGARISFDLFLSLGTEVLVLLVGSIVALIAFSLLAARLLGRGWRLAVLTGGAVSICGASAAVAIAAVLPKNAYSDRNLSFTVFSVTALSTIAMVAYPILGQLIGLQPVALGVFLGGTIHDVAQVVGAGFSVSEEVGEQAVAVKLIRVGLLGPVVLLLTVALFLTQRPRDSENRQVPWIPWFLVLFGALLAVNSFGWISPAVSELIWAISRWCMLTAIVGVGIRTDLSGFYAMPRAAFVLVIMQTMLLMAMVLAFLSARPVT